MAFTEEELRGLSASEREIAMAMDEDEMPDDGPAVGAADSEGEPAAADPEPQPDDSAQTAAPEKPPEADAGTDADPAEPAQEAQPAKAPELPRATPADAQDQRKTLRTERAEAMQRMMDGEITATQFAEIDNTIQDKLDSIVRAEATDLARSQAMQDSMMGEYASALSDVYKAAALAGLAYVGKPETALGQEFDRAVRLFANDAEARGLTDRPGQIAASKDALGEALALMIRRHGKADAAPAAPAPAPEVKPTRQPKPVDRSQFPPTLANVPAAADATVASEFAHLVGLEGNALERAVARLTPEQQDRYLDA